MMMMMITGVPQRSVRECRGLLWQGLVARVPSTLRVQGVGCRVPLGEFSNRELYRSVQLSIREQRLRSNVKQLQWRARI